MTAMYKAPNGDVPMGKAVCQSDRRQRRQKMGSEPVSRAFAQKLRANFLPTPLCEGGLDFGGPFPPVVSSSESGARRLQLSNAAQTLVFSQVLPLNPSPERKDIFHVVS